MPVEHIAALVDDRTRAIAVSSVEFVNGYRHDLAALSRLAHERGALLVVDGIQHLGMLDIDVKELGIDVLAA